MINEKISIAKYLENLIWMANKRIVERDKDGKIIKKTMSFEEAFHQEFEKIINIFDGNSVEEHEDLPPLVVTEPISQVRIAIEVLRSYLKNRNEFNEYLNSTYQILLLNLGTSYDEVRLLPPYTTQDSENKNRKYKALSSRIGIKENEIEDLLYIKPEKLNESELEAIFGLKSTIKDFTKKHDKSKLLTAKIKNLSQQWLKQDEFVVNKKKTRFPLPIIDPDIIDLEQFQESQKTLLSNIFNERKLYIDNEITKIIRDRESKETSLEGFQFALTNTLNDTAYKADTGEKKILPPVEEFLPELIAAAKASTLDNPKINIDAALEFIPLTTEGLFQLNKLYELSKVDTHPEQGKSIISDDEWNIFYGILAQIKKQHKFKEWKTEEIAKEISITPDFFKRRSVKNTVSHWRAPTNSRRNWNDIFSSRTLQKSTLIEGYEDAIQNTENVTLPALREELINEIKHGADQENLNIHDWLTRRLFISFNYSGDYRVSRIEQSIETMQDFMLSLRTRNRTIQRLRIGNTLPNWEINFFKNEDENGRSYTENHFDYEWRWMGDFNSWRGAKFVLFYPENYLLTTLWHRTQVSSSKKKCTRAFINLVEAIRTSGRLTRNKTESIAKKYMRTLTAPKELDGEIGDNVTNEDIKKINLSSNISSEELHEIRLTSWKLMKGYFECSIEDEENNKCAPGVFNEKLIDETAPESAYCLKEIFFFIPMIFAQYLQKNGDYLAALDWYKRIYSLEGLALPKESEESFDQLDKNKIYFGLKAEENIKTKIRESVDTWLLGRDQSQIAGFDAFEIANERTNAYTRYTILAVVRCYFAYADSEFTRETNESILLARRLYMNGLNLINILLNIAIIGHSDAKEFHKNNPVIEALRLHGSANLQKLRSNRNIAGMERIRRKPVDIDFSVGEQGLTPPSNNHIRSTAYRYSTLIERSKQLVALAQQIETSFLSVLEKKDVEAYNLQLMDQSVDLTRETFELQELRVKDAGYNINIVNSQKVRAEAQKDTYSRWLDEDTNSHEKKMLSNYVSLKNDRDWIAKADAAQAAASALVTAASASTWDGSKLAGYSAAALVAATGIDKSFATHKANATEAELQYNTFHANHERRKNEWELQKALAEKDSNILDIQIEQAANNKVIVKQERDISEITVKQAEANAKFLRNKFTNVELYEWMSDILSGIFNYFLQQATATAHLAAKQLAFERQERLPAFINNDYWEAPKTGITTSQSDEEIDRKGLTGSARLLQDIYKLDQHAFETNKRKHQLVQNFSLAQLFPFEFQQFRTTGILPFVTPMSIFDQSFPGHYLRLIKRIRISIIALIPPLQGLRATLSSAGISRVVTGGGIFRETEIQRPSDMIAFTSPSNATGLFEMQAENEMLLPFETMGVDSSWELRLPKASNHFNFNSIADVIFTMEYTSLHSYDYQKQVTEKMDRNFSAERPYSIKQDFPDLWYNLHQPKILEDEQNNIRASFTIQRSHFPPNLVGQLKVDKVMVYFVRSEDNAAEIAVIDLLLNEKSISLDNTPAVASSVSGVISSRSGGASKWVGVVGKDPVGKWSLIFSKDQKLAQSLSDEKITDILFVLGYSGETPAWI